MQSKAARSLVPAGFDYASMESVTAERVRSSTARIRECVMRSLESIIQVGGELHTVKEALPHGLFGPWLRAEFGWTERTARNFMAVAERFGPKTEMISDLAIAPTAAYLLAAPSAPDEARQTALERAEAGEQITPNVAKEILAKVRKKKESKRAARRPLEDLAQGLSQILQRYKERCRQEDLHALADQLREFANSLDKPTRTAKRAP
jgi:hypothetical protein